MLFNADFLLFNMDWRGKVGVSEGRPQPLKEPSSEFSEELDVILYQAKAKHNELV